LFLDLSIFTDLMKTKEYVHDIEANTA